MFVSNCRTFPFCVFSAKIMEYNIGNRETAVLCKKYSEVESSAFLVLVI